MQLKITATWSIKHLSGSTVHVAHKNISMQNPGDISIMSWNFGINPCRVIDVMDTQTAFHNRLPLSDKT